MIIHSYTPPLRDLDLIKVPCKGVGCGNFMWVLLRESGPFYCSTACENTRSLPEETPNE